MFNGFLTIAKRQLGEIYAIHRHHPAIAALIWLASMLFLLITSVPASWSQLIGLWFPLSFTALALTLLLSRYKSALLTRIAAVNGGPKWDVTVNGVVVGHISDADYANIRRDVFFDPRTFIAQILNLVGVAWRVIDKQLMAIPFAVFWLAAACYWLDHEQFTAIVSQLQNGAFIANVKLSLVLNFFVLSSLFICIFSLTMGNTLGGINRFNEACVFRVRCLINCPAEGAVVLSRSEHGIVVVPDEFATISHQASMSRVAYR